MDTQNTRPALERREPWFKFFPSDWRGDEKLQMCSLGARGLWAECMAIMHTAQPYGYLKIGTHAPTDWDLARLFRCTIEELQTHKAELLQWEVASIDDNGVLFSRRMVRKSAKAMAAKVNGQKGGRPKTQKTQPETHTETQPVTKTITRDENPHIPDARDLEVVPPLPPSGGNHVRAIERVGILAEADVSERAGAFFDRWRAIYETHSNGATYALVAGPKDYRDLLDLVTRYPDDAYLDTIAKTFVKAKIRAWGEDRKSLGWLVRVASEVDRELRAVGARPAVVA
jgi:hypothetical protein